MPRDPDHFGDPDLDNEDEDLDDGHDDSADNDSCHHGVPFCEECEDCEGDKDDDEGGEG